MKKNFEKFLEAKGISNEDFALKSADEMAGLYNEFNEAQSEALKGLSIKKQRKKTLTKRFLNCVTLKWSK